MNLATMSLPELEEHGQALADRLNNPPLHYCVNGDACDAYEAERTTVLADLRAARAEWLTRKNKASKILATRAK